MTGPGAVSGAAPAFVGRADELEALRVFASQAAQGAPRLVLVEGDAGLGKSALLRRAVDELGTATVLRAGGDEAEQLVPYGVLGQLVQCGGPAASGELDLLDAVTGAELDPSAVGAELVRLVGALQGDDRLVVLVVDDLHWSDTASAQALMFAFRRLQRDRVLVLVSGRPTELVRLGGSWTSAVGGDPRTGRIRLGGLTAAEVADLAATTGRAGLTAAAAARLREHTDGSPLHCRALLEELDLATLNAVGATLPAPRAFAAIVLLRVAALPEPARRLVTAAAVLGLHPSTTLAAAVADLADPAVALDAATAAGLVADEQRSGRRVVAFTHALVRRAIYDDLNPSTRRDLHRRAAEVTEGHVRLGHRADATLGADDELAAELAAAGQAAGDRHSLPEAAMWWLRAAEVSSDPRERERRLIEGFGWASDSGDFELMESMRGLVEELGPSARRSGALGNHAFLTGQLATAELLLQEAWALGDDPADDEYAARAAGTLAVHHYLVGRSEEGATWGERGVGRGEQVQVADHLRSFLALNLVSVGRGPDALALFADLPEDPTDPGVKVTQRRVFRGITRLFLDDLPGALRDLSAARARYRSGQSFNYDTHGLTMLVDAAFRSGAWDEASVHADFAVSLAHDADHVWDFGFVHAQAALVPAGRGDRAAATAHLDEAWAWADGLGLGFAAAMTTTARSLLHLGQGDWDGVVATTEHLRARGHTGALGRPGVHDWRWMEAEALLELGHLDRGASALDELADALPASGHPTGELAHRRLLGVLRHRRGDAAGADEAFTAAHRLAATVPTPLQVALLGLSDGARLLDRGEPADARLRLEAARATLARLGAQPFLDRCDGLLAAAGGPSPAPGPATSLGLTPTESVVAHLVSGGRTNQEVAGELFVSVKAIEFHLTNIFGKLGIRSRRELPAALGVASGAPSPASVGFSR